MHTHTEYKSALSLYSVRVCGTLHNSQWHKRSNVCVFPCLTMLITCSDGWSIWITWVQMTEIGLYREENYLERWLSWTALKEGTQLICCVFCLLCRCWRWRYGEKSSREGRLQSLSGDTPPPPPENSSKFTSYSACLLSPPPLSLCLSLRYCFHERCACCQRKRFLFNVAPLHKKWQLCKFCINISIACCDYYHDH